MTLDGERITVMGPSNLGRSMSNGYSAEGAQTTLTTRDEERLQAVAGDLPSNS